MGCEQEHWNPKPYGKIYEVAPASDSAKDDLELACHGVANCVGNAEGSDEERRDVGARRCDAGGADVVPHVSGGEFRGGMLKQDRARADIRVRCITRCKAAPLFSRCDVAARYTANANV